MSIVDFLLARPFWALCDAELAGLGSQPFPEILLRALVANGAMKTMAFLGGRAREMMNMLRLMLVAAEEARSELEGLRARVFRPEDVPFMGVKVPVSVHRYALDVINEAFRHACLFGVTPEHDVPSAHQQRNCVVHDAGIPPIRSRAISLE
jgi:hypothetical protein